MIFLDGIAMGRRVFKRTVLVGVIACSLLLARADESDSLFPNDRLIDVTVLMDPQDWDMMRREHHDLFTDPAPEKGPRPSPYNYYRGTVIIEDERVGNVGIRKK